ncbi:serine/threonine protein kinase [Streptomyces europaeiscabiei]|uniref:serine/threonine protein kinase n=1 Tax=Streptomyces europaeiscabiei TaxID=146819 RepID=UPI0029B02889|nr:serine/threonine-protein kinase [Streptomyces europaeiscabiei]MDX2763961.1 serine/threonine-protein kinase [Streptomyces europaeiscabiei]
MSAIGSGGRVQPARPGDPSRIGPYRIVGRLGAGGMGTVHAGVTSEGTRVAVKVIHPEQAQEPEFRARFTREVALSSRVTGPYLIPLLAADTAAATPWLATAYVPGPTLDQHVHERGPLAEGSLYALAAATAQALAAIHAVGVVHRDVKPQNIILTPSGPRILDFGIAHAFDGTSVTRTGIMTGTPGWISPEQYRQGTAGPAGDMFAWGALVAYAATGRLSFGAGAPDVVAFRVMSGEPDLDGVAASLRRILEKALSKEPGDRPAAAEVAQLCGALLASQATQIVGVHALPTQTGDMVAQLWDVPAGDDPAWQVPPDRSAKRRVGSVVVAAAVIGGLVGGVTALMPDTTAGGKRVASASPSAPAGSGPQALNTDEAGTAAERGKVVSDGAASSVTWAESRTAQGQGEHDVARSVLHDQSVLSGEMSDARLSPGSVTFHESRREVYFSYSLDTDAHGTLTAETEIARAMCLALRDAVLNVHPDLPYRTYVTVREEPGRAPQVTWQEDFVADERCRSAGEDGTAHSDGSEAESGWEPDENGLGEAMVPSTDRDEIRVADRAAKKVIERSNEMRPTLGTGQVLGHEEIKVGFDPANSAMYVWSDYLMWNQGQVETWAGMAAREACRALVNQRQNAGSGWPYTRYAVAEIGGSGYLMIRWGTATTLADCPTY